MGAEERRVHKEPIARDTAEKALVHRGHEGQADEKFAIARREVGEPRLFERRIEPPLGGKEGAECLHRRKEPVYPIELFGADAVQGAQLLDAHRELGDSGQEREQPLGVGRGQGAPCSRHRSAWKRRKASSSGTAMRPVASAIRRVR